jgi:medium-chain acyl-[acyl-carrier-protein] hydrolase
VIEPRALPSQASRHRHPQAPFVSTQALNSSVSRWIACPRPDPRASVRLFCLPYAGGGGSVFRQWPGGLSGIAEVCPIVLPGREARFRERPFTRMEPLIAALAEAMADRLDRPFALFGHSMGALIAFELCRSLRRERGLSPVRLFISGSRPPHASFSDADVSDLPDEAFLDCLHQRYHAIPEAVRQNRELAEIVLPSLRADFELLETYRYEGAAGLDCPLTLFGGRQDQTVSPQELGEWSRHTRGAVEHHLFEGDHFFIRSAEAGLLSEIRTTLNR